MYKMRSEEGASVAQEAVLNRYSHVFFRRKTDFTVAFPLQRSEIVPAVSSFRAGSRITARSRKEEPLGAGSREFVDWLLHSAGIDPECYRETTLARRLQACLRTLRVRSVAEARQRLEREPERVPEALSKLLIGVTEFFRDREVFSYLQHTIIPKLSSRRCGLRIWSVGCSDGAELYSVAMLLAEQGRLEKSTLLGTDCRPDAIGEAQQGWFSSSRIEALPAELSRTYFTFQSKGGRICDSLRHATRWKKENALADFPRAEANWDLILCRNVAIYLEAPAAAKLWATLTRSLQPGGVLIVGRAEKPTSGLPLIRLASCVFERGVDP